MTVSQLTQGSNQQRLLLTSKQTIKTHGTP
jgi:hypothetical protein